MAKTTSVATPAKPNIIQEFVRKNMNLLSSLYCRWQDEHQYEDINEYGARIAKEFPEGWKLVQTTKRPFGVKIEINGKQVHITVNSREVAWKNVK